MGTQICPHRTGIMRQKPTRKNEGGTRSKDKKKKRKKKEKLSLSTAAQSGKEGTSAVCETINETKGKGMLVLI